MLHYIYVYNMYTYIKGAETQHVASTGSTTILHFVPSKVILIFLFLPVLLFLASYARPPFFFSFVFVGTAAARGFGKEALLECGRSKLAR